jgi:hypothetical protein
MAKSRVPFEGWPMKIGTAPAIRYGRGLFFAWELLGRSQSLGEPVRLQK